MDVFFFLKKASNRIYSHFCVDAKFRLTTNWFRAGDATCIYVFVCVCVCRLGWLGWKSSADIISTRISFIFLLVFDGMLQKEKTKTTGATSEIFAKKSSMEFLRGVNTSKAIVTSKNNIITSITKQSFISHHDIPAHNCKYAYRWCDGFLHIERFNSEINRLLVCVCVYVVGSFSSR